jgi:hypothetical protein
MDRLTAIGAEFATLVPARRALARAVLSGLRLAGVCLTLLAAPALTYLAVTRLGE